MTNSLFLQLFFYLFSTLSVASASMVILASNPVYSILFLIFLFFNSSLILLLLGLELLAVLFILIYIGAIMVLFIFIIMMLDIKKTVFYINVHYYYFVSGILLLSFVLEMLYFLGLDLINEPNILHISSINWFNLTLETSGIQVLGCLYTTYFLPFLIAGLILLVAMIGAIVLTITPPSLDDKRQLIYEQVSMNPQDSIFYLK